MFWGGVFSGVKEVNEVERNNFKAEIFVGDSSEVRPGHVPNHGATFMAIITGSI